MRLRSLLLAAVLFTTAGQSVDAFELTRESQRGGGYGPGVSTGVGVGVGSSGTRTSVGIGLGFPLGGSRVSRAESQTEALIRLPDPAAYRRNAAEWLIRVALTDTDGEKRSATFPAPVPRDG